MYNLSLTELESYYFPTKLSGISYPIFHVSLAYNKYKENHDRWNVYDEVMPYVYLGRIPENNTYPERTKLIISAVTYGELAEVNFDYELLEKQGIRHLFVNMEDFTSHVSNKAIINAVQLIESYVDSNDPDLRQNGWMLYIENWMPNDLSKYRSSYILLSSEIDLKNQGSMIYVRSDGQLENVIINDFRDLYNVIMSSLRIGQRSLILQESYINSITDHSPSYPQDSNVYVHCKAGRARSGMILAIYIAYKNLKNSANIDDNMIETELNKSILILKSVRQQVDIGEDKRNKAKEVLVELLTLKKDIKPDYDNQLVYMMSLDFKNEICQFPSFKKFCTYLVSLRDTQCRAQKIQTFLEQILSADSQEKVLEWYTFDLLIQLKMSKPNVLKCNDVDLRVHLVDLFISEIQTHLAQKFLMLDQFVHI
jgi:protein-tyrosine phosphatase